MVIGKRIRLTDWGRQYGLDPQSTWRMLNEGRLPPQLSFFTDFDPVNREMFTVFDRDFQGL